VTEQQAIARLEADLEAKEQELERLKAAAPSPEIEAQVRQAEADVVEARTRYEDALNA
jgi:hypothetical protein